MEIGYRQGPDTYVALVGSLFHARSITGTNDFHRNGKVLKISQSNKRKKSLQARGVGLKKKPGDLKPSFFLNSNGGLDLFKNEQDIVFTRNNGATRAPIRPLGGEI